MYKPKTNERVVVWSANSASQLGGTTAIVKKYTTLPSLVRLHFDGCKETELVPFYLDELYFPNHPLGYNQPCFQ